MKLIGTFALIFLVTYSAFAKTSEHERFKSLLRKMDTSNTESINILYPKGSLANLTLISKKFTQLSGVKVNLLEGSLDQISAELILNEKLNIRKKQIDIAIPATFSLPDLATSKTISILNKFDKSFKDIIPNSKSLYERGDHFDNKRYGYQTDGDTYLLFLNKKFLSNKSYQSEYRKLYRSELRVPKTWSELDRQIKFFHRPKEKRYGGLLFRNRGYIGWEFLVRLHAHGLTPFDQDFKPQVNNPTGLKILKDMLSINSSLYPGIHNIGLFKNFELFKAGNVYANIGWGGTQKSLMANDSKIKKHLIHTLIPGELPGIKNSAYFNWGWSYVITSSSKAQKISYLFIRFAVSDKMSEISISNPEGFFDPYKDSHYTSEKINNIYSSDFLSIHKKSLRESIPDFNVAGRAEYMNILNQAIFKMSKKEISPKLALSELERSWNKITKRIGADLQKKRWKEILESYPASFKKGRKP